MSFIGNVLGAQGQMSGFTDENDLASGPAIWMMGWDFQYPDPQITNPTFAGHVIRDGNWDWLLSQQTWLNTPGGFSIPNSLYLSSKPAFFGTCTWPWVDPTTGTTYTLPAMARYDAGTPNSTATPCSGGTTDTTPATVTITAPTGQLAANTTSTTLSVTTNEAASCAYSNTSGTAFASMTPFTTTGGTSHSTTLSGLTNGSSYTAYVKCEDTAGNISTDSSTSYSVALSGGGGGTPLSLDGSANNFGSGTSISTTLTTTNANDVIIVGVAVNDTTITSVFGGGLTWNLRAQNGASGFPIYEWYAIAPSPLSGVTITVNFAGSAGFTAISAFGISGASTSSPFDTHSGIPVTGNPDPLSISTSNANDFIFGLFRMGSTASPTSGSGWTQIPTAVFQLSEYQIVSTPQTSLGVTIGTGVGDASGGIGDAVVKAP
jgi:hypothetical protein